MGRAWERFPIRGGHWDGINVSKSRSLGISAVTNRQRGDTLYVKSLPANLLDFCQVIGSVGTERLDAHRISIAAAFPDICKSTRGERDVSFLRDIV